MACKRGCTSYLEPTKRDTHLRQSQSHTHLSADCAFGTASKNLRDHEENYDITGPMLDKYIETFLENPCISGAFVGIPRDDVVAGVRHVLAEPSNGGSHFISTITHATKRCTTELVGSERTLPDRLTG